MGFGFSDSQSAISTDFLQKINLNLRSNSPSVPVFIEWKEKHNSCLKDCFEYTFTTQNSDHGDSGAAFSYIEPSINGGKNVMGVISSNIETEFEDRSHNIHIRYLTLIQGINKDDINMIDTLRDISDF